MKNRISRSTPDRMQEVRELFVSIQQEAYKQGYDDGKMIGKQESNEGARPLTSMFDELFEKPKSANQQRAELIQKAKDFVEAMKCGEGNVFDKVGRLSRLEFYRKNNRVTCVINPWDNYSKRSTGRATCSQGDVFNEHIGQAIAFAKAKNISIPVEFLEAVQPTVVFIGTVINYRGKIRTVSKNYEGEGTCQIGSESARYGTIIDDTNAQYGIPS